MCAKSLLFCLGFIVLAAGCAKSKSDDESTGPKHRLSAGGVAHDAAAGSLRQKISRGGAMNELKQLGTFYVTFNIDRNRSPASLHEFGPYIERDANALYKAIQEGAYEVQWNVREMSGNSLLAYEKTPNEDGEHLAVMGDSSVKKLSEKDLQAALRQK